MEVKFEIYRSLNQLQEKYIFYIIALSFSAIGFSVYLTMGKPLIFEQIPLGLAVLSWGLCIYYGFNYVKKIIESKSVNFEMLKLEGNRTAMNLSDYSSKSNELVDEDQRIHVLIIKYYKYQEMFFYIGIGLFLVWHVLEMALASLF